MPETLYGPAASLLKGAADTNTDTANREAKVNIAGAEMAQAGANERLQQQGAMDRQKAAGEQQMMQLLETAKQNAIAKKQEFDMDHSFVIDQDTANGLAKVTGNQGFASMSGQRVPAKEMLAMASNMIKAKYQKPQRVTADIGNGPQELMVSQVEDADGNKKYDITPIGKAVPKGSGSGKSPEEKDNADLLRLEKDISGKNKTLLSEIKRGNLPEEAWGGEPGNVRKLEQYISAGNFGNLDDTQKARVNAIGGMLTTMREQNSRANDIRKRLGKGETDYTGFNPTGGGGDDAALSDYMKKNKIKDTPANRQWAKGKMNAA